MKPLYTCKVELGLQRTMPKPPKVEESGFRRCPHGDKFMIDVGGFPPFIPIHEYHHIFHRVMYETGNYKKAMEKAGLHE